MSNSTNSPASSDKLFADAIKNKAENAPKEDAPKAAAKEQAKEETKTAEASKEQEDQEQTQAPDELEMLKSRARLMGINFSNNIGVDALRAKIQEKLSSDSAPATKNEPAKQEASSHEGDGNTAPKQKPMSLRQKLWDENMKLVRVRITNLDPKKKDLPGEIFTVANEYLGAVKKFIPYGEATDNGYHIPYCIYKQLQNRKFVSIKTRKGPRGQTIVESQMAREFALDVLPPLTEAELARLAAAQASRGKEE